MSDGVHVVCPGCLAVNRLPAEKLAAGPKCGKCHVPLLEPKPLLLKGPDLARQVEKSGLPLLVDFWAPWCGPCRMMAPAFEEAARLLFPTVRLAKLNTEEEPAVGSRLGIQSIPTMVLFRNGREVDRISGALPAQSIVEWARSRV